MKNIYKKAVSLYTKEAQVFVQRKDDNFYISDGKTILKIDKYSYKMNFAPKSIRFPVTEYNETLESKKNSLPEFSMVDLATLLNEAIRAAAGTIKRTRFSTDMKDDTARIYKRNEMILINSKYDDAAKDVFSNCDNVRILGTDRKNPVIWGNGYDFDIAYMILPINYDSSFLDDIADLQ